MCLEVEVEEILQWAEQTANKFGTSPLKVLIAFDNSYRKLRDIQMAKGIVERI